VIVPKIHENVEMHKPNDWRQFSTCLFVQLEFENNHAGEADHYLASFLLEVSERQYFIFKINFFSDFLHLFSTWWYLWHESAMRLPQYFL